MTIQKAITPDEIKIGTKFWRVGRKQKRIETVTDILKTYNSKNELVATAYKVEHEFMGQTLSDTVNVVTIQRGVMRLEEAEMAMG